MHLPTPEDEKAVAEISSWVIDRLSYRADTLPPRYDAGTPPKITTSGIGMSAAWAALRDQVLPTALPTDHPGYLAFIPGAPSVAAVLADMAVSASGVYAGTALEGGGVVAAERAALQWLAELAGLPGRAHGAFVSGGSIANLSALVSARHDRRARTGQRPNLILTGTGAHASISSAAAIMGCDIVSDGDPNGRLDYETLSRLLDAADHDDIVAVAATAGATNNGAIDDLEGIAALCLRHGLWLHVDAAYGGGALVSQRARALFAGIEAADSITIDPHKWLFTPFDCAAVIYRNPERARQAHTQTASYLDAVADGDNPSDYAVHLTRRARGIPLWVSLLANGSDAYVQAVDRSLMLAQYAAERIEASELLDIVGEPTLSIVLFRRGGWAASDYAEWSRRAIRSGLGLVTPTTHDDEPALRLCFVNPVTTEADIERILNSLN
jgi:glutamate/tyrosine decarboxylase-like PLP-dependent enzyme